MKSPLHILHLEDDPHDASLVHTTLDAAGISCTYTCAHTRDAFVAALRARNVDLILLDCSVSGFDAGSAMSIARSEQPALPLILISEIVGEDFAIDSLKSGATDYVLKGRLSRLVHAVHRAMFEVEARTERRQLEAQVIEAQKMEVIGRLAGGVAHDFNNVLAVIMGYGNLLVARLGADSPLRHYGEEILHASERAVGLTRQLLVFSRKEAVQPVVLDLAAVVNDLDRMLRRLVDENVSMTIESVAPVGRVRADSGYVGQVLMNLVVNARDAMPDGGRLTIGTRNATLDDDYVRAHPGAVPGDYVMLSVKDTGTGMTDEVKAHLFEPFYTTKTKGKGTGLGLATCRTIVQQSNGHIDVTSEIGKGTTLQIYFPRVDQPFDAAVHSTPIRSFARGTETLLVVEDEPSLRHLTAGVLEEEGYTVLRASNGQDGLRVIREHRGSPIRLVVTDVVMPLMGGRVMAEWLQVTYSDLKVLFTSGYTDDVISNHEIRRAGVEFLAKPYTPATLARKVREMLDGESECPGETEKGVAPDEIISTAT